MTEVTTTPAPVVVAVNKAKKIRDLRAQHPDMSAADIAKNAQTSEAYVYMTLKAAKHKKVKANPSTEKEVPNGQQILRKEITRLNNELDKHKNLAKFHEDKINFLLNKVKELKDHHAGLEYVVSYLEARLGEKNGATV